MALALAMVLQATPIPAVAVTGYDSAFLFESDWLIVKPGDTGQAAVTFLNVGSVSWQKGGASQVNLATCCPLNSPPTHAAWLVTPLSSTAYATHREDLVAPGGRGTYIWNFKVPDNAAAGIYDFPGDLVLASTGEGIHREGYFHRNDNRPVAPTGVATKLALSPKTQNGVLGTNVTVTATVTADPPAGTAERPGVANVEVTFFVDGDKAANADFTRTATTGSDGKATLSYTRSAPGVDNISAWVSANPTVRDTAVVLWGAAVVITVTPDDAATVGNTQCRVYNVTIRNPETGAVRSGVVASATFSENRDGDTATATSATINGFTTNPDAGTGGNNTTGGTSGNEVDLTTTDTNGVTSFSVCGTNTGPATPIVWIDQDSLFGGDNDGKLDSNEFRDTGGSVTFSVAKATISVTPDTAEDVTNAKQRVYTVTATSATGTAFQGNITVGFSELTDADPATTTTCTLAWIDNDSALRTTVAPTTGVQFASGTAPFNSTNTTATFAPNGEGKGTFATTGSDTACTPVSWQDVSGDGARQSEEPQDLGGKASFKAVPGVSSATLRPSSSTANASSGEATPVDNTPDSDGEIVLTFTLRDAAGNSTVASTTTATSVTFNVQNTGSRNIFIVDIGGTDQSPAITVSPGATQTVSASIAMGGTNVTITLDATNAATDISTSNWTSASTTGFLTGNSSITGTATQKWVIADAFVTSTGTATASGTVLAANTLSSTGDGGNYLVDTGLGVKRVAYATGDNFRVSGTSTNEAGFEGAISAGDSITVYAANSTTDPCNGATTTTPCHDVTTNVP